MKPFASDVAKQARYEVYLAGKSKYILAIITLNVHTTHTKICMKEQGLAYSPVSPLAATKKVKVCLFPDLQGVDSRMTEWERQKEKEEFSRVAKVFQPLASSLTSRFTRGGTEHTKEEEEGEKKKAGRQPERPLVCTCNKVPLVCTCG